MYQIYFAQGGDKLTLNLGSIAQPAESPTTTNLMEVRFSRMFYHFKEMKI